MSYPENVEIALRALRTKSTRTLYAATIIRTSFPDGMPEELRPLYVACRDGSRKGVEKALRALDGKAAA
jgi:hypothetical protein